MTACKDRRLRKRIAQNGKQSHDAPAWICKNIRQTNPGHTLPPGIPADTKTEIEMDEIVRSNSANFLAPAVDVSRALIAYQAKKDFIKAVLVEGVDFGTIPGAGDKPALKKPGAEKLSNFFGLSPVFEDVSTTEDWTGENHSGEPFFYYRQRCKLYSGERMVGSADGSCNSWEKKYRYRGGERLCPQCAKPAIKKSKFKPRNTALGNAPGWYCFDKAGGCGAEFAANDPAIVDQVIGQVKNVDVAEQVNTILKMAQKRALVAAILIATGASDYFTQDIEDFITVDAVFVDTTDTQREQRKAAPAQSQPETQPAMTLEQALETTGSDGKKYSERDTKTLAAIANNAKAPAEKRQAARMIIAARAKQQAEEDGTADPTYGSHMPDQRTGDGENQ
jgi:hypothetical protein